MTVVLGVTHPISWNNAACLLVDGELVAMAEEERFTRVKHAPRTPPSHAVRHCLRSSGIEFRDIDRIAVGFGPAIRTAVAHVRHEGVFRGFRSGLAWANRAHHYAKLVPGRHSGIPIVFVNHHRAHAASAFYASGFSDAAILTLDGSGGSEAGTLADGDARGIGTLARIGDGASWGSLYEDVSVRLGFARHSGEGKTMGLAAYGESRPELLAFIDWSHPIPRIDRLERDKFLARIPIRRHHEELTDLHRDLAATIQQALERAAIRFTEWLIGRTGRAHLCLAGGVGLNCSMNGVIQRSGIVEELFVQPVSHDAGTALGAALEVHRHLTGRRPSMDMKHAYWGPQFSDAEIGNALRSAGLRAFRRTADVATEAAESIRRGDIIGWFQGRAEVGPRALGARSILANPTDPRMRERVNSLKGREQWRPFAPALKEERVEELLENPSRAPFMCVAYIVRAERRSEIAAAVHVDGTCRPQTVSRSTNPLFWNVLDALEKAGGPPAVLNTSFNVDGEPIVSSPTDAINTFISSGLDRLIIGSHVVERAEQM